MADDDGVAMMSLARSPNHKKVLLNLLFFPKMSQVKK